jgi:hypothetical protein
LLIINNGSFRAAISSRAVFSNEVRGTLFRDYNNGAYYVDPASASYQSSIYTNNWFRPQGATGLYSQSYGYGIYAAGAGGNPYGNMTTYGSGAGGWSGIGISRKWTMMSSGTGNSNNFGIHNSDSSWLWYWNGSYKNTRLGYLVNETSMRAPLFYDQNSTGYYADLASTSDSSIRQRGGTLHGPNVSWGEYLAVGGNGRYNNRASVATTNGNLHLDAKSGRSTYINWYVGGTTYVNGAIQANIYYDRDSTSYYGNFASTSYMNDLRVNILYDRENTAYYFGSGQGDFRGRTGRASEMYSDGWFRNYSSGRGLYNQATGRHFYSPGSSYWHLDGGGSSGGLIIYDRYQASQGSGTGRRGYLYYDSSGFGLLHSGGGWAFRSTSSQTEMYGTNYANDVRANIFYDRTNTAYYFGSSSGDSRFRNTRINSLQIENGAAITSVNGSGRIYMGGNFHIDAYNGNDIYVNYYSNRRFRVWNGSGSESLRVDTNRIVYAFSQIRTPLVYDYNNTGYYSNQASTSNFNQTNHNLIEATRVSFRHAGGNSGQSIGNAYSMFQTSGGWGYPYPALRINYHVGIDMAANPSYQGIRFMNDYNSNTVRFQINGGSSYTYANTWLQVGGGGVGIYDGYNGAHFFPNNQTSYTSWNIYGSRGGYYGIALSQAGYDPHFMWDGSGNGGIYLQGLGRWTQYHSRGNNCTGFGSSATRSGYRVQINGSLWATGNVVAYSDRRKKENIETIENALLKVLQLRGVTYTRILEDHNDERDDSFQGLQMGMIAQEVEEVIPEVVSYDAESDEYGLDYPKMVGLLVESIKDQNVIVESQKEIINNQQKDIDILKEMVYNIQQLMENK